MDNMRPAVKKGFEQWLKNKENASGSKKYPQKQEAQKEQKMRKPGIPAGIARDIENMRKDKLVDDEYEAGEEARKKNMGEIGFKSGGSVGSASKRADGCAVRGKTKGRMI